MDSYFKINSFLIIKYMTEILEIKIRERKKI